MNVNHPSCKGLETTECCQTWQCRGLFLKILLKKITILAGYAQGVNIHELRIETTFDEIYQLTFWWKPHRTIPNRPPSREFDTNFKFYVLSESTIKFII
jgi:hypothetical protein